MKRRKAIKSISIGAGIAVSGVTFSAFLSGCKNESPAVSWTPSFFTSEQSNMVELILDVLLPKTATPGAKDLGIIQTVDNTVKQLYKSEDQQFFLNGLLQMETWFKKEDQEGLHQINREEAEAFVKAHYDFASEADFENFKDLAYADPNELKESEKENCLLAKALINIKRLGITSYFRSEIIGTQHLSYDPIPGQYIGCIPSEEVGNSWSL